MGIENLAGKWPNVAINPATGKTYETEHLDNGVSVQMCLNNTREQLEEDLREWIDIATYKAFEPKRMLEVMHHWLNRQADISWNNAWKAQKDLIAEMQGEIEYLRKVCQTQADSFAAIENENAALRSKLNRIRELAERLQDA